MGRPLPPLLRGGAPQAGWIGASGATFWAEPARRPRPKRGEAERESAHAGRRGLGASEQRSARRARAADGPPESEAERESAHAGRRGLGASEQRSARRARAADGPPESEAERESAHAGRRGLGASEQRSARRARAADGPPRIGGRARERSRRPTGSGGIGA